VYLKNRRIVRNLRAFLFSSFRNHSTDKTKKNIANSRRLRSAPGSRSTNMFNFGVQAPAFNNQQLLQGNQNQSYPGQQSIRELQLAYATHLDQSLRPIPEPPATTPAIPNNACEFNAIVYNYKTGMQPSNRPQNVGQQRWLQVIPFRQEICIFLSSISRFRLREVTLIKPFSSLSF